MNLEVELSSRAGKLKIERIACYVLEHPEVKEELYAMTRHENDKISRQAWWVCESIVHQDKSWLITKQDDIVQYLLPCKHGGKKRIMLNILYRLPIAQPLPVELLNFCMDKMLAVEEAPAAQAICMKLAYAMCEEEPDLLSEFYHYLDNIDAGYYSSAVQSTRRTILKEINKRRKKKEYYVLR